MSAVPSLDPAVAALLRRDPAGLVAAVVQQHDTGEVLMLAWMDDEALHRTLDHRPGHLLVAQPRRVLGEGRDLGQPAVGARGPGGLRRRRAAGAGRPGGRGLPHRRAQLLPPGAAGGRGPARVTAGRVAEPARRELAAAVLGAVGAGALALIAGGQPWARSPPSARRRCRRSRGVLSGAEAAPLVPAAGLVLLAAAVALLAVRGAGPGGRRAAHGRRRWRAGLVGACARSPAG